MLENDLKISSSEDSDAEPDSVKNPSRNPSARYPPLPHTHPGSVINQSGVLQPVTIINLILKYANCSRFKFGSVLFVLRFSQNTDT